MHFFKQRPFENHGKMRAHGHRKVRTIMATHIYAFIPVHVCVCMCAYVYIIRTHIYAYIPVHVCVCMYVCICIRIYAGNSGPRTRAQTKPVVEEEKLIKVDNKEAAHARRVSYSLEEAKAMQVCMCACINAQIMYV